MDETRTYPEGVPSWIDIEQPDLDAAQAFYGGLFGWTFEPVTPPDAPLPYVIARLDGREAAGLGGAPRPGTDAAANGPNMGPAMEHLRRRDRRRRRRSPDRRGRRAGRPMVQPTSATPVVLRRPSIPPEPCSGSGRHGAAPACRWSTSPGAWNFADLHSSDAASVGFYVRCVRVGVRRPGVRDPHPLSRVRRPPRGDGRSPHPRTPVERRDPATLRGCDRMARARRGRRGPPLARQLHRRRSRRRAPPQWNASAAP